MENVNVSDSLRSVCYYGEFVLACVSLTFLDADANNAKEKEIARDKTKLRKCQLKLLITSTCFLYAGLAQYLAVAKLCSKVLIDAMQRKLLRRVRLSLSTSLTLLAFGRDGEWMKVHLMLDSWLLAE